MVYGLPPARTRAGNREANKPVIDGPAQAWWTRQGLIEVQMTLEQHLRYVNQSTAMLDDVGGGGTRAAS